jgi:AcrR family transcriptional regulator
MTALSLSPGPRPRKAPSQARSRATTEAVLLAAAHILETGGLAAFNTNAVAVRAGVSIGSLYQYFPNKDAILVALLEQQSAVLTRTIADLTETPAGPSLIDDLRALLVRALQWHAERPQLSRILDAAERRLQPYLDPETCTGAMHAAFYNLVERRRDELGGGDLARAAADIGALTRTLMEAEAERPDQDWPSAIDRTLGAVRGYLSTRNGPDPRS